MAVGFHILADLYGVDPQLLKYVRPLKHIFESSISQAGLTKITSHYHQFTPFGVSGTILIEESHVSFHTWPEYELITLDIYTCGDREMAEDAFERLIDALKPKRIETKRIERGVLVEVQEAVVESPSNSERSLGADR